MNSCMCDVLVVVVGGGVPSLVTFGCVAVDRRDRAAVRYKGSVGLIGGIRSTPRLIGLLYLKVVLVGGGRGDGCEEL